MTRNARSVFLTTAPTPGQAIADTVRNAVTAFTFEILKSDLTPIGTVAFRIIWHSFFSVTWHTRQADAGCCVNLSPCPNVPQYILQRSNASKLRGHRFVAKTNVCATDLEVFGA